MTPQELITDWRAKAKSCKGETEYDEGVSTTYVICAYDLEVALSLPTDPEMK